jgi:hypothetical protein
MCQLAPLAYDYAIRTAAASKEMAKYVHVRWHSKRGMFIKDHIAMSSPLPIRIRDKFRIRNTPQTKTPRKR